MQKVKIPKRVGRQLYRSSPTILTVVASVGVIVTIHYCRSSNSQSNKTAERSGGGEG